MIIPQQPSPPPPGQRHRSHRHRRHGLWTLLLALLLTTLLPLPASALELRFEILAQGFKVGENSWQIEALDEHTLRFQSVSRATGLASWLRSNVRTESSEFRIVDQRVQPLRYRYSDSKKPDKAVAIDFDWSGKRAHVVSRWEDKQLPLTAGMQDPLSHHLDTALQLLHGRLPTQTHILKHKGERHYSVHDGGLQSIALHHRQYPARLLERRADSTTRLWLDPALAYLPLHIDHRDGDEHTELLRVTVSGTLPPGFSGSVE